MKNRMTAAAPRPKINPELAHGQEDAREYYSLRENVREAGYPQRRRAAVSGTISSRSGSRPQLSSRPCRAAGPVTESLHGDDNVCGRRSRWRTLPTSRGYALISRRIGCLHRRSYLQLDPRAAARWLLSNPIRRHLVPPWARVVLRDAKAVLLKNDRQGGGERENREARKRYGPEPKLCDRLVEEMRKIGQDRLGEMREKRDATPNLRASRETCVKGARGGPVRALSELQTRETNQLERNIDTANIVLLLTHEHGRHWMRAVASERNDCRT